MLLMCAYITYLSYCACFKPRSNYFTPILLFDERHSVQLHVSGDTPSTTKVATKTTARKYRLRTLYDNFCERYGVIFNR